MNVTCKKGLLCKPKTHSFVLGIKAYPDADSIKIGDTLWLEVNEPTTLFDRVSSAPVDYSKAKNLGTSIAFGKLLGIGLFEDQNASKFAYILKVGIPDQRPDSSKYRDYLFSELNGKYQFKLGIIPKEKGVFKMFVSNASNVFRKNEECTKAGFQINFTQTNTHYYLNKVVAPDVDLTGPGGAYLFKVI
jgi:hypothetical protein